MNSLMSELYAGEAPIRPVDELAAIYHDGEHFPEQLGQLNLLSQQVELKLSDTVGV
jgi:hypothetical protein